MTTMSPIEALEWAADYADRHKLFEVPTNRNGYPVDGFKQLTPAERVDVLQKLAATVMTPAGITVSISEAFLAEMTEQLQEVYDSLCDSKPGEAKTSVLDMLQTVGRIRGK